MPQPGRVPKLFVFVAFITEERFVQRKLAKNLIIQNRREDSQTCGPVQMSLEISGPHQKLLEIWPYLKHPHLENVPEFKEPITFIYMLGVFIH